MPGHIRAGRCSLPSILAPSLRQLRCPGRDEFFGQLISTAMARSRATDSCSDPTKDVEFVKVVDGQTNEAVCEGTEATHTITYVTPPTTMCIKKAGA